MLAHWGVFTRRSLCALGVLGFSWTDLSGVFTDHISFGISSISLSMTVLFSQHACVMVLTRLSESSRRGGEEV